MSEQQAKLPLRASFPESELEQMKVGVIPEQMEDKWFIFFENDWLYFHRSWTDICAYQTRFEKRVDEFAIAEGWVSLDAPKWNPDPEVDVGVLSLLIYSTTDEQR